MRKSIFLACIVLTALLTACNKKDPFQTVPLENIMQLQPGKYIIYKLDSLNYVNFNRTLATTRYQAKDVVDAAITDNLGRPSWRVIRYLRDSASTNEADWKQNITYMITVTRSSVEVVEENQRYIKLMQPLREGFTWKGNAYINPESFDATFSIDIWDYTYANVYSPFVFNDGRTIDSTITVNQRDEILGDTSNPANFSVQNFSKEVYAPNIGLIYKELFHSEYQPEDGSITESYYFGYGIKLRMISHN